MMHQRLTIGVCSMLLALAGCNSTPEPEPVEVVSPFEVLPPREVPDWLRGSLYEQVDVENAGPLLVSGFGLVANLDNTGDTTSPNSVREYLLNTMAKRGIGSVNTPGFERVSPQAMLRDPRIAVVRVDALIPPGARRGQRVDVLVSCLEGNNTTSLAGGVLWRTDLSENGGNPRLVSGFNPPMIVAAGEVFVNPAFAIDPNLEDPTQRTSLRSGIVMHGGVSQVDRPIALRVRSAQGSVALFTAARVNELFQDSTVANPRNEALIEIQVPRRFEGDWQHFTNLLLFSFYDRDPRFAAVKAQQLAEEMVKPSAPLLELSYAMEALGQVAIPELRKLYGHESSAVSFAAARAGAFLSDVPAIEQLVQISRNTSDSFNMTSVRTLASLPSSPALNQRLRDLLDAPSTLVRLEAYRALVKNRDVSIASREVQGRFMIDLVPSKGQPIVYATRLGTPRIAIIGSPARFTLPVFFSAMNDAFMVSTIEAPDQSGPVGVNLFFRGRGLTEPLTIASSADLAEVLARLAGDGPRGERRFDFTYPTIVALLTRFHDQNLLASGEASLDRNNLSRATFVLQDLPGSGDTDVMGAPIIPTSPRPMGDEPPEVGAR